MDRMITRKQTLHLLVLGFVNATLSCPLQRQSLNTCAADLFNLVAKTAKGGKSMIEILLNMTDANGHVPHSGLLVNIECFGIMGSILA